MTKITKNIIASFMLVGLAYAADQSTDRTRSSKGDTIGFWLATAAAASATYADAYSTTHDIRPRGNCRYEVGSPELYSRRPYAHAAQTYEVMTALFAVSVFASYEMRRHRISRYAWPAPAAYLAVEHAEGAIHNWRVCR